MEPEMCLDGLIDSTHFSCEPDTHYQYHRLPPFSCQGDKLKSKTLQQFRIVVPTLLYVIGMPRKFCQEKHLRSKAFFGQYGHIKRILINGQTKKEYESQGQCAVYVWYESSLSVALALCCLNGLRIPLGNHHTFLRCSFGTSKYCANFLKEADCEAHQGPHSTCPFLHYVEHRRDMVIQDDFEFKEYLAQQNIIASDFLQKIGLDCLEDKNGYL